MIGKIITGSSNGGGRLYNHFSIMRLRAWNSFWRVVLHCVGMRLVETIRMYMMFGVWYAWRSWACLVR